MPKPKLVRDALRNADSLKRELDADQRGLVEKIHALVLRMYQSSDSKLFAVYGFAPDLTVRSALVFLFREHRRLQLEARWIASYLYCPLSEVGGYEEIAKQLLLIRPDSPFSTALKSICREMGVEVEYLPADHS